MTYQLDHTADQAYIHPERARVVLKFKLFDRAFRGIAFAAALFVLLLLGTILVSLVIGAWPALSHFGLSFFMTERWSPSREIFGALAPIYGTLVTSCIAMILALPAGLGIAIFLNELCPPSLRAPIGVAIELLAGIPSIIYGIWGFFVLAPFLKDNIHPVLINFFAPIPGLNMLFQGPSYGIGLLTAGLILAIMILPFITAISRDVLATVPPVMREAAFGLGSTKWEVVSKVVIPHASVGLVGGAMLGLGRALGETMAVTFVVGNSHSISSSLLAPATTISAAIANEFQEASDPLYTASLIALGLILFFITFMVLAAARFLLLKTQKRRS